MLRRIILLILLFVTSCEGFLSIDLSTITNRTINRLNLTCFNDNEDTINCEYCVYQFFSNGSASTINYDCVHITNTYKSITKRCQGFSDTTDIGYGTCSPLPFEVFVTSILCICATNMCNTNLTSCQSSVNSQIESNTSPSVLPSVVPDFLSTSILCDASLNVGYTCTYYGYPYVNVTQCNNYFIDNTLLCLYAIEGDYQISVALTEDVYTRFIAAAIYDINQSSQGPTDKPFYNETSSYFYSNVNVSYNGGDSITTDNIQRCFCAQNNCDSNLTSCLTANKPISVTANTPISVTANTSISTGNSATKNVNNIFVSIWINLIIQLSLIFIPTNLIFYIY